MEGQEIPKYEKQAKVSLSFTMKQDIEACVLPPLELRWFSGNCRKFLQ